MRRSAVVIVLLLAGCAGLQRDARLRRELDDHRFHASLPQVWPEALRIVAAHDYPLFGKDNVLVGKKTQSALGRLFSKGRETHLDEKGRWSAETSYGPSRIRYRVVGTDTGDGTCRVEFIGIPQESDGAEGHEFRDVRLELELVRQLEPEEASRIDGAVHQR